MRKEGEGKRERRRSAKIVVFEDVSSQVLGGLLVAGWFSFLSYYSHMTRVQKSIWQWSRNNFFCAALPFVKYVIKSKCESHFAEMNDVIRFKNIFLSS